MKGLDDKIAAVGLAELRCMEQREQTDLAIDQLKGEIRRAATPTRIVVSGLVLGFAAGLAKPGEKIAGAGSLLSGPLFTLVLDTVVPGVLAGVTAAMSGLNAASDDADEATEAEEEEVTDEEAAVLADPETRRARPDA